MLVYMREHLTFLTLRRSSHKAFEETGNFFKASNLPSYFLPLPFFGANDISAVECQLAMNGRQVMIL